MDSSAIPRPSQPLETSDPELEMRGLPEHLSPEEAAACRKRILEAVRDFLSRTGLREVSLRVGTAPLIGEDVAEVAVDSSGRTAPPALPILPSPEAPSGRVPRSEGGDKRDEELTTEERARQYRSRKPIFDFDFLVVPDEVREDLLSAVDLVRVEEQVFGRWNLRKIEPFPRTALNFHGPPGTGKTLAAHALTHYLDRPILPASYAQVESKFVGDGAKNIEALFHAAERDRAVLFIDEADSLLSRRLTSVTQGAEQAINSMRSQLLICLEHFKGVVIFSTNLVENYDRAFESRIRNVFFPLPDEECRREIWRRHLPAELPLKADVSLRELARLDDVCGRDIKNAVIDAALRAARSGRSEIGRFDLEEAVRRIRSSRPNFRNRIGGAVRTSPDPGASSAPSSGSNPDRSPEADTGSDRRSPPGPASE